MSKWNIRFLVNVEEIGTVNTNKKNFQEDSPSLLLFDIALIPLTGSTDLGYQHSKTGPEISHLLYKDDLKIYRKS